MGTRRGSRGLQKKFASALVLAGLLPAIAALVATYLSSNHVLKHSIGSNFQEIAANVAKKVEMIIDHDITDAQSLALSPDILMLLGDRAESPGAGQAPPPDAKETHLADSVSEHLHRWQAERAADAVYKEIVVIDRSGRAAAASVTPSRASYRDQGWWKAVLAGSVVVSNLYPDPEYGHYYYDLVVPVRESDGPVLGALLVTIRRDKLLRAIMEVRIGKTGHAMLVSSNGTPLICPILPPREHLINDPLMRQIAQPGPGWAVAADDAHNGRNSIVGYAPIRFRHALDPSSLGQMAWYSFVRQNPEETYAPIYSLLATVGLVGSGLVLGISFLGFFAGYRIVRPILLLKEEARALGEGVRLLTASSGQTAPPLQLAKRIEIQTRDEIEDLASAFNRMTEALEESLRTIQRQQAELVQKEKLASLAQMMAALTHDLKNPLSVIRSSAQILRDKAEEPRLRQEMCQYIIEEVDRLTFRINDILRFSRPRPPRRQRVSAEALVDRVLSQVRGQQEFQDRVILRAGIEPGLPAIEVDPDQIHDALLNLLVNALEAISQRGEVSVQVSRDGRGRVVISLRDSGEGIPPGDLDRIFDPFFTTKPYGVGLGLTNVKRLVESNGGSVVVSSEPGRGTTFHLAFPAAGDQRLTALE